MISRQRIPRPLFNVELVLGLRIGETWQVNLMGNTQLSTAGSPIGGVKPGLFKVRSIRAAMTCGSAATASHATTGPLLRTQGLHWVHSCGAASREVAGERGRRDEPERHRGVRCRVDGLYPE